MKHPIKRYLLAGLFLCNAGQAYAVAYCSLRDPVNTIYEFFPEASNYRSNVQNVGREARQSVQQQLPFDMHFNELGRHTLYIAQEGERRLGFVHARSEISKWGLTEFAWAFDVDMKVRSVKVQRSRDVKLLKYDPEALNSIVMGKGLPDLQKLYLDSEPGSIEQVLATAGMKVLVVSQSVWPEEILGEPIKTLLLENFGADVVMRPIVNMYDDSVLAELSAIQFGESALFVRDRLKGFRVIDMTGQVIGMVAQSTFDHENKEKSLVWMIDRNGTLLSVTEEGQQATFPAFADVVGYTPRSLADCSGPAELGALELAVLARSHADS